MMKRTESRSFSVRNAVALIALAVVLCAAIYAGVWASANGSSYDGSSTDVSKLAADPTYYDTSNAQSASDIIVQQTLDRTESVNAVTAVVFDWRGYDTMGEAFVLITAIAGATAILRRHSKDKKGGAGHE